jgi:hypothetical protein
MAVASYLLAIVIDSVNPGMDMATTGDRNPELTPIGE